MVSFIVLTIGAVLVALGVYMLNVREEREEKWVWVGFGQDPFRK